MSILNKIRSLFEPNPFLLEKRGTDGRLKRGSVRRDGKILWAAPRINGVVKEQWMTPKEYANAVLKNRLAVQNHYKKKAAK